MDNGTGYKIDFIKRKYQTIQGVPVEDLPERQIGAIYWSMVNRQNRQNKQAKQKPIQKEIQLSFFD